MKVGLLYFSGTGNTKIITDLLRNEFRLKKWDVEILKIENILRRLVSFQVKKYDILGLCYPIHAFNAPKIVFDFIKRLPLSSGKNIFIIRNSGDPLLNGGATSMVRKRLRRRGYNVIYEQLFIMPSNVFMKYDDELIKQLYNIAKKKSKIVVDEIISGKIRLQNNSLPLRAVTYFFSKMESQGASYFGKSLRILRTCNLCNICVDNCPVKNISIKKERIQFGDSCFFCMRCIYICPKRALTSRFFGMFILKEFYDFKGIINNPKIKGNYLTENTKGYFKRFNSIK